MSYEKFQKVKDWVEAHPIPSALFLAGLIIFVVSLF